MAATTFIAGSTCFANELNPLDDTGCVTNDCYYCLLDKKYACHVSKETFEAQKFDMKNFFRGQYPVLFPELAQDYSYEKFEKVLYEILEDEDTSLCGVKLEALIEAINNGKGFFFGPDEVTKSDKVKVIDKANLCIGKAEYDFLSDLNGPVELTEEMKEKCVNSDVNKIGYSASKQKKPSILSKLAPYAIGVVAAVILALPRILGRGQVPHANVD